MNKTPEELAEEYSKVNTSFVGGALGSYRQGLFEGFLAGYQAAINSPEKPDSCEHILDMEKMVDADKVKFCVYCNDTHKGNCAVGKGKNHPALTQPQWISVKDRLPKIDQWCSWWDISGATEPCTAFRDVNDIETWWENYTHWMPLPELPVNPKYVSATNKIHYYLNFHTRGWEAPNIVWLNVKDFKQMYEEMEELQRSKNDPMWTNQLLVNHGVRSFIFRLSNIALNVDAEPLPDTLEEMKTWNNKCSELLVKVTEDA